MSYSMYVKQKASRWAPFVFLIFINITSTAFASPCGTKQYHETVQVSRVYDGDTVKLNDGRKLRFIGINTPERGRDGENNQPFYSEAKSQLETIIRQNNSRIKIVFGKDKHDRYKRLLAHPFTLQGDNISALLIEKGLGFRITVPPNVKFNPCYQTAENKARNLKLGIWNHSFSQILNASSLHESIRGFHQVTGTVQRVGESRSSFWLNLNKNFALRIMKKDLPYFKIFHPEDLLNQQVIARGWIYKRKNELRMKVKHPASLTILKTD